MTYVGTYLLILLALARVESWLDDGEEAASRDPETGSGGHAARSDAGHPTASGPSPSQADAGRA